MNERLLTILLVEDNPVDLELTLRAFRKHKVSNPIAVARDGEEALDYVHRRGRFAAGATVPGLILLDIRLPKMDGYRGPPRGQGPSRLSHGSRRNAHHLTGRGGHPDQLRAGRQFLYR